MRRKGLKIVPIHEVSTFGDGETIEVPGSPRVVHTPGHTEGSCAILLEPQRTLITGDALATRNPLTGRTGPQIGPDGLNHDSAQALRSLDALATLPVDLVLPGPRRSVDGGYRRSGPPGEGGGPLVKAHASEGGPPRPASPRRIRYAISRRSIKAAPSPTAPSGPRTRTSAPPSGS